MLAFMDPIIHGFTSAGTERTVIAGAFYNVTGHSRTSCHPGEIRPTVTSHFPTRGYPHEKAPHTRAVAGPGQSAA